MIDRQVTGDARADRVCTFFSDQQPALLEELTEFVVEVFVTVLTESFGSIYLDVIIYT